VQKLLELEIPEIFEKVVEVKQVVRVPGYKSKVVVASNSTDIDPVGTCVGVGGVRIRPILKELGQEKVDLIEYTEDLEQLVATALKPAEIDRVFVDEVHGRATVWLAQDQRSFAIGKQGQNIALVSRLTGLHVQLQEDTSQKNTETESFGVVQEKESAAVIDSDAEQLKE
jgi:N utilization substance protein A